MAAIEHAFTDPLPSRLYLDTDIVIAALVATDRFHSVSRAFFDRIMEEGEPEIVLSSLSWLEFANAVTRDRFRRSHSAEDR